MGCTCRCRNSLANYFILYYAHLQQITSNIQCKRGTLSKRTPLMPFNFIRIAVFYFFPIAFRLLKRSRTAARIQNSESVIEENEIMRADVTNFPICSLLLIYYGNFYICIHSSSFIKCVLYRFTYLSMFYVVYVCAVQQWLSMLMVVVVDVLGGK